MQEKAVSILNENRIMAIATMRADGWPQSTLVGYANNEQLIYFVVSREGQKFANIQRDDRVSLSIGRDFHDPSSIRALSISGHASEITDAAQRERAVEMLLSRHPGLRRLEPPAPSHSAVMLIFPNIVTILDYSKGFGHSDVLTVSPGGVEMTPARDDYWGFGIKLKPTG
jgi:nitroimidazol reductase NimA-like FMN-containing flavoprotein (pyridoxamine 5'-phosphate oxidase superfamily)